MIKIKPVLTEKTMALAKTGKYTFDLPSDITKFQARELIGQAFGVTVKKIRSANAKARVRKNMYGRKQKVRANKRFVVEIGEKDKIEIFNSNT